MMKMAKMMMKMMKMTGMKMINGPLFSPRPRL